MGGCEIERRAGTGKQAPRCRWQGLATLSGWQGMGHIRIRVRFATELIAVHFFTQLPPRTASIQAETHEPWALEGSDATTRRAPKMAFAHPRGAFFPTIDRPEGLGLTHNQATD